MTLSPGIMTEILEAAEDQEITTTEVEGIMSGVFNSLITAMVIMGMMNMFIKAINPPKEIAEDLREIAEVL